MREEIKLWGDGVRRINGVTGNLFAEDKVDAIVMYMPKGLVAMPIDRKRFLSELGPHPVEGNVRMISELHGEVKYFIDGDDFERGLSCCDKLGVRTVSMNGRRTKGYSECENVAAVLNWLKRNPDSCVTTVNLVDRNGGFVRLGKLRESGKNKDDRGYSTDFELYIEK